VGCGRYCLVVGTKPGWVPNRYVADSALAVEAALPELARRSRRWYDVVLRVLGGLTPPSGLKGTLSNKQGSSPTYVQHAGGAPAMAGDLARGMRDDRLAPLKFAASELADELSTDERKRLRQSGELPDWFLPRVQDRAVAIRKDLRRRRY
jgi:hypothetical protein